MWRCKQGENEPINVAGVGGRKVFISGGQLKKIECDQTAADWPGGSRDAG
jgi:hypothetical protein